VITRVRTHTPFGEDLFTYLVEGDLSSFKKATDFSESPFYKEVIDGEIKSIVKNNT